MKSEQIETVLLFFFKKERLVRRYFSSTLVAYIFLIYLPYLVQHLIFASFITTKNVLDIDDPRSCPSSVQHTYLVPRSPTARIRQSEIQLRDKCEVSTLTRSGTQIEVGGAKGSEEGRENSRPLNFPFLFSVLSISGHSPITGYLTITPRVSVGNELAIIISYPTSACEIIVLLTTSTKYR